jgi:hypothetical protein
MGDFSASKRVWVSVTLATVVALMGSGVSGAVAVKQPDGNPNHAVRDPGIPDGVIPGGKVKKRLKPKADAAQVQESAQASQMVVRYEKGVTTKQAAAIADEAVLAADTEAVAADVAKASNGFRVVVLDKPVPIADA